MVQTAASQADGEQVQGRELGDKGLGGGHPDLGAGVGVDHAGGFPGNGGIQHVADGHVHGAARFGLPQGRQGVGGLPRLGDDHHQRVLVDDRVAVAELRGDVHLDRDAAIPLDVELADQGGVPGGAAGHDDDPFHGRQLPVAELQVLQVHVPFLLQEPPGNGVAYGAGLFMDLLEHEVPVTPLFGHERRPVDVPRLLVQRSAGDGGEGGCCRRGTRPFRRPP